MTSRLLRSLCLVIVASAWLASCEKVAQLSDSARVEKFTILTADPDRVIFDQPVIKGEVIELPLVYGKYLFPITITVDVKTEAGCKQILGFDGGGKEFTFDNQNHVRELYTVAASGATTRWKLQIVDAQSNESAEIARVGVTAGEGSDMLAAPYARIDRINSEIIFQALGTAAYPLTFVPEFTLADGADWADGTDAPAETLTFEEKESSMKYTVEAASGLTKSWTFRSEIVAQTDNTSSLTEDQVERLTPDVSKIKFQSETAQLTGATTEFNVSKIGGRINLMLRPAARAMTFPVKATVELPVHASSVLFGASADNSYTFESYADTKQVWIVDKTSGLAKSWTIAPAPELNTDILSFTIADNYTSKLGDKLVVGIDQVEIDHDNSRIIIPVEKTDGSAIGAKEQLTLKLSITVEYPEGSTSSSSKSPSFTYITNTALFTVKSTNGQQSRNWTLYLKDKNAEASSDTNISNFSYAYTSKDNRMKLSSTSIVADNNNHRITLKITAGPKAFPLTLTNKIMKLGNPSATIVEQEIADYDTPLTFESLTSTKTFTVRAEDGTEQQWTIDLESQAKGHTAEITSFLVGKITGGSLTAVKIEPETQRIRMEVEGVPPFYATVSIETSENATVTGLENGILTVNNYNHEIPLTVTSQDEEVTKTWTVYTDKPVEVQIDNSEFELWGEFKNINGGTYTIDPTPGAGYGWGTANLELLGIGVLGTMPVERADGTLAAEMTTSEQNTILKGYIVAAGTLYTGLFNLNINYITQPRKMTKFGIPYTARPTSFSMEVKYAPGAQMKQATADDKGKYSIHDIAGVDKAHIWVELLQWSGSGAIDYDGSEGAADITVLGRAELVIDGANNPYKEWSKITLPMVYNPQYADITPTHIAVVMSSSKDGDKFIGAIGSKLSVDHFVINY